MSAEHNYPKCTGFWCQYFIAGRLYWRCGQCRAIAYSSNAVAEAVLRENQLGVTLRQLSNAGDYLDLSESEEPWQW